MRLGVFLSSAFLFFVFAIFLARPAYADHAGKIRLRSELTVEVNKILSSSERLHKAMMQQEEDEIEIALRDVLYQLEHVRHVSSMAKDHERAHLVKILDSAHEYFELVQSSYGEERRESLEDGFNQIVNLVRIYRLDHQYSIFFCPKDKLTWVQKGSRAENPFRHPASEKGCGIRITD